MTQEATPLSVGNDDNLRIAFVPSGNPISLAVLTANTTKLITYSLTPDGWGRTITENDVDDPRLSLKQIFSRPGNFSDALELQYVYGDANDVAKVALTPGTNGFLTYRDSLPNATEWAVGQKVDALTCTFGKQRRNPRTANGVQTMSQKVYLTSLSQTDALIVA